ncbi:MAG: M61 family metallopeptidase [Gammaproteobacteria bacterium]|nr:M61 family metallopeptidase [Gammaproteobacteria bacterium]
MNIQHTVNLYNPHAHIFKVTLEIAKPDTAGQVLSLPAWIPGSYMIRDFAKNIISIKAQSNNQQLSIKKLDKSTWKVEAVDAPLLIEYEVYAWDLSVRSAHFDMTHAFFNGTSLFLMPHGFEEEPCNVIIEPPANENYSQWKVATSLKNKDIDALGFGAYQANNYDDLIDHPVEIGTHSEFEFSVENTTHKMALTGVHRADEKRLNQDLTKICQTHCTMFGDLPKIEEYIFLTMVTGNGYGGLEHRSSTSLMCSRDDLPLTTEPDEPNEKYRNFLGLCSHEYFHTWNIKRIKPEVFLPYDLTTESYTRQLWAFEGITSYYDELALVRSKVISVESYLELIGQTITRVLRGKGRFNQSIAESSFEAWTKFYKQDESAPNTIVSYYAKGALLALCLDLTIRKHTDNQKSLDDVMRHLWINYGKKLCGVPEGKIENIASEIAGVSLNDFFANYLYGVRELPLKELLSEVGVKLNLRATTSVDDKGGKPSTDKNQHNPVSLGARFATNSLGVKITQVFSNESAELAGLSAGDIIISINHLQVTKEKINKTIASYSVDDELVIHAFRRDELKVFNLTLKQAELSTCYLTLNGKMDDNTTDKKNSWLKL